MRSLTKEEADFLYMSRTSPSIDEIDTENYYTPEIWEMANSLIERGLMTRALYIGEVRETQFDTTTSLGLVALACFEASKT